MKKPQSKVQTQEKSNIKFTSRAENARESNQYLLPHHTGPQPISELGLVVRLTTSFSVMLRPFPCHSFEFKLYQVMMLEPVSDHLRQK